MPASASWLADSGSEMLSRMSFPSAMSAEDVIGQPARVQFEAFLDEHRRELNGCLDGLTEDPARQSLVPSRTTLQGLVKHATLWRRSGSMRALPDAARRDRHPRDPGRVVHPP
jgi:hypothetical protein